MSGQTLKGTNMAVRGIFASHSSIMGDRVSTLSSRILIKGYGGTATLLALSSGMKEEKVTDTNWSWVEDSHISGNTNCPAGATNVATTMVVADPNLWVNNSVVLVESTGEHILVTGVSGTTVTMRRAFAGTTAAAIPAAGTLQLIGSAHAEGGSAPDPISQSGESYQNFVQIFKNGWAITGTAKAIQYLTGSKLAQNKEQCIGYHSEDIERAFLFGRKGLTVIGGKELRTSNGVLAQLADYGGLVVSANYGGAGQMSTAGLQNFIRQIFDRVAKGLPNERIAFTSTQVMELIQQMVRKDTRYDLTASESEFGFNIWTLSFLSQKIKFMTHPMMVENATWAKQIYVLHPGLITKRILRPTWTQNFTQDGNTNAGVDADSGFIADELGFELKGAELHGMMTNITTAVAS